MASQLNEVPEDADALGFEHIESFNLLCVGESGLGKSTFLRDIFAHLDPTKLHEMRRRVSEQSDVLGSLEEAIRRNEHEGRQCDDERALQLRAERITLKARRDEAHASLDELRAAKRRQEHAVASLRAEIEGLTQSVAEQRARRDAEEDDEEAARLGQEVIGTQQVLKQRQETLAAELRRSNLDKEGEGQRQTTEVTARLIKEMPLYEGARRGLDVTLIDTPGYGDLLVDSLANSSADKVCAEVEARISSHLAKERATRAGMPLQDEKKYWNELVHLCLFFISPHRMKRADVELMRRLHHLVPLVVVVAKSDTMTAAETRKFKADVSRQLAEERVSTFVFDPRSIKEVEALHSLNADDGFAPLYGGADGALPWAVMGADESRRHYLWGTAITNDPRHSELPALRDLVLRAGGWEQLKREAALKADVEGVRRAEARRTKGGWGRALLRALRSIPREQLLGAAAAAVAACVVYALSRYWPWSSSAHEDQTERLLDQISSLKDDLAQCTQVRTALDADLEALRAEISVYRQKSARGAWW